MELDILSLKNRRALSNVLVYSVFVPEVSSEDKATSSHLLQRLFCSHISNTFKVTHFWQCDFPPQLCYTTCEFILHIYTPIWIDEKVITAISNVKFYPINYKNFSIYKTCCISMLFSLHTLDLINVQ